MDHGRFHLVVVRLLPGHVRRVGQEHRAGQLEQRRRVFTLRVQRVQVGAGALGIAIEPEADERQSMTRR